MVQICSPVRLGSWLCWSLYLSSKGGIKREREGKKNWRLAGAKICPIHLLWPDAFAGFVSSFATMPTNLGNARFRPLNAPIWAWPPQAGNPGTFAP